MLQTKNTYAKALEYRERGWSVIPVGLDKRPKTKWQEYQTRYATDEELEKWFYNNQKNNIGIVTGKISGITVVDIDKHSGGTIGTFPSDTLTVKTGNGGLHLYYQYDPRVNTTADVLEDKPGIDIRNDGGFVVAPPSIITPKYAGEDGIYETRKQVELAPFPAHMFKLRKSRKPLSSLVEVPKKSRNASLTTIIGSLLSRYPQSQWDEVYVMAKAINATYKPPLDATELDTIWKSIAARQKDNGDLIASPIQIAPGEVIDMKLRRSKNGVPYKDMVNAVLALSQNPKYAQSIRYNMFRHEIEYNNQPLSEEDIFAIQHYMQADVDLANMPKSTVHEAIQRHAFNNKYDEALDWLNSLEWDGVPRLTSWLRMAGGVEDSPYYRAVGSQWLIGMVKRLIHPGCVFDHVLCATGPQGCGKTSLFRIIGGEWYKAHTESADNKDFFLKLRGACLIDLDEGATMFRTESIKLKSVITETCDEYRAPYDRVTMKYPRRFIFSMSTNDIEPFKDQTGNRRYWIFKVEKKVDFAWLQDNREQLFAEAYNALKNNVEYPEVPLEEATKLQEEATDKDEWFNDIMAYIYGHLDYRKGDPEYSISIGDIYKEALGGESVHRMDTRTAMRIGNVLRNDLKMEKRRISNDGVRQNKYYLMASEVERLQKSYKNKPDTHDTAF